MSERERSPAERLEDLRRAIQEGIESLERGEGIDGEEAFRQVMASLSEEDPSPERRDVKDPAPPP